MVADRETGEGGSHKRVGEDADYSLGELLRGLRTRRGLSLSDLARQAGVAQSTLSRWEQNRFQPRLPELEAVLNTLAATPMQRRTLLERMNTPRAHLRLSEGTARVKALEEIGTTPPHGGDLLRALRRRAGRTSDEVAQAIGISIATLWRWERGDTWPDVAQLQTLCFLYTAREAEYIALTCGRYSLASPRMASLPLEALEHNFRTELEPLELVAEVNPGRDLEFLRLEAAIWPHAVKNFHARLLLGQVSAHHANYLSNFRQNSSIYLERALEIGREVTGRLYWRDMAVIRAADHAVWRRSCERPAAGLEILRLWGLLKTGNERFSWTLRKAATYYGMTGNHAAALEFAEQFAAHPDIRESESEPHAARRCHAEIFILAGHYGKAIECLGASNDPYPPNRVWDDLLFARAELKRGNSSQAQDWIAQAYNEIAQHGLDHMRTMVNKFAMGL